MGTRGAYGFRINGKDKVTYNHWDSYPDHLGKKILEYVSGTPLEMMIECANRIILVDENSHPSSELIHRYKKYADIGVSECRYEDWYCLIRKTQGDLFAYNNSLSHMIDYQEFLSDSLFCEWAYIINLDTKNFEAYQGFNKNPKAKGRYAKRKIRGNHNYKGVALIKEIPLADITENTIAGLVQDLNQLGNISNQGELIESVKI